MKIDLIQKLIDVNQQFPCFCNSFLQSNKICEIHSYCQNIARHMHYVRVRTWLCGPTRDWDWGISRSRWDLSTYLLGLGPIRSFSSSAPKFNGVQSIHMGAKAGGCVYYMIQWTLGHMCKTQVDLRFFNYLIIVTSF